MVPRSNWIHVLLACRGKPQRGKPERERERETHVDAAGQRIRRKAHFKPELVDTLLKATLTTEDDLILEQSSQAITQIFRASTTASRTEESHLRSRLAGRHSILEDLDKAMQTNHKVCDADGSNDFQHDGALDGIAGEISTPRIVGFDIVVGDAAIALAQLRAKLGQEGRAIPTERRRGRLSAQGVD